MKLTTLKAKHILFALVFIITSNMSTAQVLSAGDIAIVGVNSDPQTGNSALSDEITIVTLNTIPTGTTIYISDFFWDATNNRWGNDGNNGTTLNVVEGIITWTTTAPIPSGTVFRILLTSGLVSNSTLPSISGLPGSVSLSGWSNASAGAIATTGDNLFIYQGINGQTPNNWIFGWCNGVTTSVPANFSWQTNNASITGITSMLPTSLTNGVNAIALSQNGNASASNPHYDNNVYNIGAIRSGTKAQILAGICTPSNWIGNETTPYDISTTSTFYTGANAFSLTVLPVKWLYINGNMNAQKQASINFKVNENNVSQYVIEKSNDGRSFVAVGNLSSIGNGENTYRFTDVQTVNEISYYRVKQMDVDGRFSFSPIVKIAANASVVSVFPNPVTTTGTVSGATVGATLQLVDVTGKLLQNIKVTNPTFTVDMSGYSKGLYLLQSNNQIIKIVKD